jgi:hypothetical protein
MSSGPPATIARLSLLDLVCAAADDPRRPLDFAFLCHLPQGLSLAALRSGAESAMNQFPVSGSRIQGGRWVWVGATGTDVVEAVPNLHDPTACLDRPIDPHRGPPVRQLIRPDRTGGGQTLVTRFHHAACDGVAAQLWLAHQLQVASGVREPTRQRQPAERPRLRGHPAPRRRNHLAPDGPSRPLATRRAQPGPTRRWLTMSAPAWPGMRGGCSESEALAASFLGALVAWDEGRGRAPAGSRPLGLWVPVNIRRKPTSGFGNGTSRIRLHAHFDAAAPLTRTCELLRRQRAAALREGEWAVPERSLIAGVPGLGRALIRFYTRRPGVDMGSAVFTHLVGSPLDDFPAVDGIEGVQMLDRRHPLALTCVTVRGTTFCTFTYDPALLSREQVVQIGSFTCDRLDQLRREPRSRAA